MSLSRWMPLTPPPPRYGRRNWPDTWWKPGEDAAATLVLDQAPGLEAAEDLADGAALDFKSLRQGQDGTVVALRGRAENDGLGVAELGHG